MNDARRYLLLVNPSAGAGRVAELLPRAKAALAANGLEFRTVETRSLEHGVDEAREAAAQDEIPLVMSGDGLIGQVGGALAGTGVAMGVVPGGRGNDLARVLRIPTDPDGAIRVIAAGTTRTIDVGEVNGRRFVCIASCGFDSDANRIANETKRVRGNLVYLYAALRAVAEWKPARFEVTIDGRTRSFTGYSVGACNNRAYGGGMFAAPEAELDDGLFDVLWCDDMPKPRFLTRLLPKMFSGAYVELPEVHLERGAEVRIEADRPFAVYADGDHLSDLPATIRVLPRALELFAAPGPLAGPS